MPSIFAPHVIAAFRAFAWVASLAAIALGLTVLAGWEMGSRAFISMRPGLAAMAPLTALSFVFAGCSLVARRAERHRAATWLAMALLALGAAVLTSHLALGGDALNPTLEHWLAPPNSGLIGRTSPATAASILLLGGALLCVGIRGADRRLTWCAAPGMLLSALALLGYAYGVEDLYAIALYRTMALHTAGGLLILFLACLVADPEAGWAAIVASGTPGGLATRRQLVMATVFPFLIGLLVLREVRVGDIGIGFGVAIVVAVTMIPLVLRIL